ncbi:DNA-directed RNA polymerase III subunit rpc5 [Drechmeria coniospora]|uniref:DNA-directed RNA polymerase III subunit rpc5 n=1 Tax=Drechmeria coniospora TaxID=98403 RepID=A0A151GPV0_DRECN|nr:DNA-directed RNA polymerase III subunit rpc5 [Drechmeria coniospora]KYK59137.1 DNA-directed RNA polymerase III subunit rpc5 [Drechmeria coniospora]
MASPSPDDTVERMDMDIDPNLLPSKDEADDEDDPITASYSIFLNPAPPLGRRLLVLQHPNRTDDTPRPPPTEMRLKAHSGMVEVDMPIDTAAAYDREKGLKWGRTLHSSMATKNGGSHGLAGGFGFGAVQQRGPGRKKTAADDDDEGVLDWNDAVRQDKVLRMQTLGGQYPDIEEVQYMLHHIDATTQQERNAASSAAKEAAPPGPAARAIHMTIKTTTDGDTITTETMADRLRYVQTEPWRKLRYTDENDEASWEVYNDTLFLKPKPDADGADVPVADAKGDLEEAVSTFASKWGSKQMLEAVSDIVLPEPGPRPQIKPELSDKQQGSGLHEQNETPKLKGKARSGSTAAPPRKGSRSKASSSKAAVSMD